LAAIEMISKQSVIQAGTNLLAQVGFLIGKASNFPPRECGGWSQPLVLADANVTKARQLFVNATRQELGIDSASLPAAPPRAASDEFERSQAT
jgi:hypothetical protein